MAGINIKIDNKRLKRERRKGILEELYASPRLAEWPRLSVDSAIRSFTLNGDSIVEEEKEINPIYLSNINIDIMVDIENKRLYIYEPLYKYIEGGRDSKSIWIKAKRKTLEDLIGYVKRVLVLYAEAGLISAELVDYDELRKYTRSLSLAIDNILGSIKNINDIEKRIIKYYVLRDIIGFDVLEPLVSLRQYVEDVVVAAPNINVKASARFGASTETYITNIKLSSRELNSLIEKIIASEGKSISLYAPLESIMTKRGHRVTVAYGREVTYNGPAMVVRLFAEPWNIIRQFIYKGIQPAVAAYLGQTIALKKSTLLVGVMGSGKTSMLNSLSSFIPKEATIVTIEDTPEIRLPHKFWIRHVTRVSAGAEKRGEIGMFELMKHALRESADYIIIGEVRGEEGRVWAQAIATGHGGLTTFHAENPYAAIARLTTEPIRVEPALLSALYNIATLRRSGRGRYLSEVYSLLYRVDSSEIGNNTRSLVPRRLFRTVERSDGDFKVELYTAENYPVANYWHKIRNVGDFVEVDLVVENRRGEGSEQTTVAVMELADDSYEFRRLAHLYKEPFVECKRSKECLNNIAALSSIYETNPAGFDDILESMSIIYVYLEILYALFQAIRLKFKDNINEIGKLFNYRNSTILIWSIIDAAISKKRVREKVHNFVNILKEDAIKSNNINEIINNISNEFREIKSEYENYLASPL